MISWQRCTLREVVAPVDTWSPARGAPDQEFTYIDLSAVDQDTKEIAAPRRLLGRDAPSRARQLVATGDVLVSTVRPNLNGVAQVPRSLDGATASTGFCVLRPIPTRVDGRYLFHWVRTDAFIGEMMRLATGASYPAVSDRVVMDSMVPLPSLTDQRRIAETLDRADELRRKREAALSGLDELQRSVFRACAREMDLADAEGRTCFLGELMAQRAGSVDPLKFPDEVFDLYSIPAYDGGVPETLAGSQIGSTKQIVQPGDVLLSKIVPHIRRAWVVGEAQGRRLIGSGEWIVFRTSVCEPEYLRELLLSDRFHAEFMRTVSGVGGSLLRARPAEVSRIQVSIPPLKIQRAFVAAVKGISKLRNRSNSAAAKLDALFASLQHRAFQGEL